MYVCRHSKELFQIIQQLIYQIQIMYVHGYTTIDGSLGRTTGALIFLLKIVMNQP